MKQKSNKGAKSVKQSKSASQYLSWKSLNVKVYNKRVEKQILINIDGLVQPGDLLALMGASGSGKSTLLNVLTFRSDSKLQIEGQIILNGMPATNSTISMVSSYVEQDYLFFGTLTGIFSLSFLD